MSVCVRDIVHAMEQWAPTSLAYSWDNVGLQLGDPDAPVERVLVCLSVTEEVLGVALREKVSMIVAHHPIIFKPLKALRASHPQEYLIMELIRAGIACYAAHTNLDVTPGGVSYALATQLGLTQQHPLFSLEHAKQYKFVSFVPESHLPAVREALSNAGAGVIGDYTQCSFSTPGTGTFLPGDAAQPFTGEISKLNEEPERRFETIVPQSRLRAAIAALYEAHPYEEPAYDVFPLAEPDREIGLGVRGMLEAPMPLNEFAEKLCRALPLDTARVYGDPETSIHSVAVLGGSGGGELRRLPMDVDLFVTGDVKYHEALDALQLGHCIIDAGHRGTELPILPHIKSYLQQIPSLDVHVHEESEAFTVVSASATQPNQP